MAAKGHGCTLQQHCTSIFLVLRIVKLFSFGVKQSSIDQNINTPATDNVRQCDIKSEKLGAITTSSEKQKQLTVIGEETMVLPLFPF